jgi:hypothetical protein
MATMNVWIAVLAEVRPDPFTTATEASQAPEHQGYVFEAPAE